MKNFAPSSNNLFPKTQTPNQALQRTPFDARFVRKVGEGDPATAFAAGQPLDTCDLAIHQGTTTSDL